ncbi:hypothetical protein ACIQSO_06645 [Pseudomonas putida]|uniref:hypothetical protein n=1 Tax=Pseudomonas putida TaxID=303 RepID=UPI00383BD337
MTRSWLTVLLGVFMAGEVMASPANTTLHILNDGKPVAALDIPPSVQLTISAERQETSENKLESLYSGDVRMSLTSKSGENVNLTANEAKVVYRKN